MKFKNTRLASPVIYGGDRPHEYDLFNFAPDLIPKTKKQYEEFIADNKIITDEQWWEIQRNRCIYGYTVKNGITEGGEVFLDDEKIVIHDPNNPIVLANNIVLGKDERYIPHLNFVQKGTDLWIPPKMYFYLNFWTIKRDDKEEGRKIESNPYFTDLSWENWMIRRRSFIEEKDHLWSKCRQRGMSEEEAANLAWFFLFLHSVQLAIISGEDFYVQNTFSFVKRGINKLINTQFYKQIGVSNDELLTTANSGASLHARTARNNTQALSGLSPFYTLLEEVGIWKKNFVIEVMEFIRPSLKATGRKTGYLTLIGTGGKEGEGVDDMETMMYDPKSYGLLEFPNIYEESDVMIAGFVPKWKFEIVDKDFNSLKAESLIAIEKIRADKKDDARFLEIVTGPIIPAEMFGVKGGTYFGNTIKGWCIEQKMLINNHRVAKIARRYRIDWINKKNLWDGCKAELDEDGDFIIIELPQLNKEGKPIENLYWGGTDSYDQDESNTTDSLGAIAIKKGVHLQDGLSKVGIYNNYVASLVQRPRTDQGGKEVFYENTAKLCMLYGAMNMIEHSKILIMEWYHKVGLSGMLMEKPGLTISNLVKVSEASNRYGFPGALISDALSLQRDYLGDAENVQNCFFPDMLNAWARFKLAKNYNCDLTIATTLATIGLHEYKKISEVYEATQEKRKTIQNFGYKEVNGKLRNSFGT